MRNLGIKGRWYELRRITLVIILVGTTSHVLAQDDASASSTANAERVPDGVLPEAWAEVRSDIESRGSPVRVMSAGVYPVPSSGCRGITAAESEAEANTWYRLFAEGVPECSLIALVVVQGDMIKGYVYVESDGEWIRWERSDEL